MNQLLVEMDGFGTNTHVIILATLVGRSMNVVLVTHCLKMVTHAMIVLRELCEWSSARTHATNCVHVAVGN